MKGIVAIFLGLVLVAACSDENTDQDDAHAIHWGYEGNESPEHWASLSPDYAICAEGAEQSPMSPEQLAAFVSRLPKNNRPVQALGERSIGLVTN